MTALGKVSLTTFGLLLFWTGFVLGIESLSRGSPAGLIGVSVFVAALVALMRVKFGSYLGKVTRAARYPARGFIVFAIALMIFLPQVISLAGDPLAFTNVHVTRSLIDVGVAAGLSAAALVVNGIAYFVSGRWSPLVT